MNLSQYVMYLIYPAFHSHAIYGLQWHLWIDFIQKKFIGVKNKGVEVGEKKGGGGAGKYSKKKNKEPKFDKYI